LPVKVVFEKPQGAGGGVGAGVEVEDDEDVVGHGDMGS
jgi:hypothetical protein